MNGTNRFDFTIDDSANAVSVVKEFEAELAAVWDAFTRPEILDQWWAPKPWKSRTKYMDFTEGGKRFYAMVSPEGQEHWSVQQFTAITPKTQFGYRDYFTDAVETKDASLPGSAWQLNFTEANAATTVNISIKHETRDDLEKILAMGFKAGFTATLNYLETLLATR